MSFLSGLKAAYDSLEITKTFDSSKEDAGPKEEKNVTLDEKLEEPSVYSTPSGGPSHLKVPHPQGGVKGGSKDLDMEGWSSWDDQGSGITSKQRSPSPSKPKSSSSISPSSSRSSLSPGRGVLPDIVGESKVGSRTSGPQSGGGRSGSGSSSGGPPLAASTPSKSQPMSGKSQLDSLSRDDLVKYIKKQAVAFQKSKVRVEELHKELEAAKQARSGGAEVGVAGGGGGGGGGGGAGILMEELQVAKSERDQAVADNRSLKHSVDSLRKSREDIQERHQALEDAHSKLKELFREQQVAQGQDGEKSSQDELDSLSSVNSTLSAEVASLRSKLEEQAEQVGTKEKQFQSDKASLESRYAELVRKAKKMQSELKVAREKVASQESELQRQVEEKEELSNKVDVLSSQMGSLEALKGEARKECGQTQARCQDLEVKLAKEEERAVTFQEELGRAQSECVGLKEQLTASVSRAQDVEAGMEELRKNSAALEQQLSGSSAIEDKWRGLSKELAEALRREEVLKDEVASLQANLNSNAGQELSQQKERDSLKESIQELEKNLETEKSNTTTLRTTTKELEKSVAVSQQRVTDLEGDYQHLQAELQHSEEMRRKGESCLVSVQQELTLATSSLATSQEELKHSHNHVAKLESDVSETSLEIDKMKSLLDEKEEKMMILESERKSEEEKLVGELDKATSHRRELEEQLKSEREENKIKLAELQGALDVRNDDFALAEKANETLQSALEVTSQECQGHLQQVNSLQASTAELQDKLHRKEAEFEVFQKDQVDGQNDHSSLLEARIKTLQEQNERLSQERDCLKEQKREAESGMLTAKEAMEKEILEAKSALDKADSSYGEENKKLKVFASKIKKELAGIKEQLVSLQKQHQSVLHETSQKADEQKTKLASLAEGNKALEASLQELEALKGTSEVEIANLKAKLIFLSSNQGEKLDLALSEKDQQLQVNLEELQSVRLVLQEKSQECTELQGKLESSQSEKSQLQQKHEDVAELAKKETGDIKQKLSQVEEENLQLRKDSKTTKEQYEAELEDLRQAKDSVYKDLVKAQEEIEATERSRKEEVQQARGVQEKEAVSHREENRKLKAFAMKLKKELADSRERESSLTQELQGLRSGTEETEQLKKKLVAVQEEKLTLVQSLQVQLVEVQTKFKVQAVQLDKTSEEAKKWHTELEEAKDLAESEISGLQAELATARSESNSSNMAAELLKQEMWQLKEELEKEAESHSESRQRLAQVEKEVKASSLMNMELQDYQRSIQALETGMATKEHLLEKAKQDSQVHLNSLSSLKKDIETVSQQRSQSEETVTKLKQLLMKTKKEMAEGQRREEGLRTSLESLRSQLEQEKQGAEQAKVELASYTARIETLKQQSEVSTDNLQRVNRGLEQRLSLVQSELSTVKAAMAATQTEYDGYKVRVHSVLKQKSSGPGQAEVTAEIRKKYEQEVHKLKMEVQDLRSSLSSSEVEHEELLVDHEQLTSRHQQLLQETELRREALVQAQKEEASRHAHQSLQQDELISQLRMEAEEMTVGFKGQLHSLQSEHSKVCSGLKEELEVAHADLARLQQELDSKVLASAQSSGPAPSSSAPNNTLTAHEGVSMSSGAVGGASRSVVEWVKPPAEQRSSGEGMEQSQLESVTSGVPSTPDSAIDFERLLSLGDKELSSVTTSKYDGRSEVNSSSSENHVKCQKQLKLAAKKVQHLTELLRESEASSLRLGDQAKLLKEEIRRLERNQAREKGVSNMEYLKNVILKFLHNEGEEKKALVPVIQTLLLLSPQEAKYLEDSVIRGYAAGPPDEIAAAEKSPKSSGWSGYVHRWTGY